MIVTHTIDIAQPPGRVYEVLADPGTWRTLDPNLVEMEPPGPLLLGATGIMIRRVAGRTVANPWTIAELEPGARLGMRLTGAGYELIETTVLQTLPEGTRAIVTDVLRPTSVAGRLFVALSGPFVRRDLRARSGRLKALVEMDPTI